jgi:hypothetical protein
MPSLPARRADRFPKPRCNQPKCRPPVRPPSVCLPEEWPPPKCPPAEWPPPPPRCASADASRHITANKIRNMCVGHSRKAIRLAIAFHPRESTSSLLLFDAREYGRNANRPTQRRHFGPTDPNVVGRPGALLHPSLPSPHRPWTKFSPSGMTEQARAVWPEVVAMLKANDERSGSRSVCLITDALTIHIT